MKLPEPTIGSRLVVPSLALAVFAAVAALYAFGDHPLYMNILTYVGMDPFRFPFLDIHAPLAIWECARAGIDVRIHIPCDIMDRANNYSPLLINLAWIPLGPAQTIAVGLGLDILFIFSLAFLPPPRGACETVLTVLATVSTMVIFALERANLDVLIFVIVVSAGLLIRGPTLQRCGAYTLILGAALIKYYPLFILGIMMRERLRMLAIGTIAVTAILAWFVAARYGDVMSSLSRLPTGPYMSDFFGAKNLPFHLSANLVVLFGGTMPAALQTILPYGVYLLCLTAALALCRWLLVRTTLPAALSTLGEQERIFLVMGSLTLVGCFFAAQNIGYRGVYLLLVLPGLLAMTQQTGDRTLRRIALFAAIALVMIMWSEGLRRDIYLVLRYVGLSDGASLLVQLLVWLVREIAWWSLVSLLTAIILDFLRSAPAFASVMKKAQKASLVETQARSA